MKIWLLDRIGPCGYDEYDAKVILAPSEQRARELANTNTADEGRIWDDPKETRCVEVIPNNEEILLESFNAG